MMSLRFWLVPPRVRGKGRLQRPAYWHLRVLRAVPGARRRHHIASCRLPPTPSERADFLALCRSRLLDLAVSTSILDANLDHIVIRLDREADKLAKAEAAKRARRF